jgi:hypothetical protein
VKTIYRWEGNWVALDLIRDDAPGWWLLRLGAGSEHMEIQLSPEEADEIVQLLSKSLNVGKPPKAVEAPDRKTAWWKCPTEGTRIEDPFGFPFRVNGIFQDRAEDWSIQILPMVAPTARDAPRTAETLTYARAIGQGWTITWEPSE